MWQLRFFRGLFFTTNSTSCSSYRSIDLPKDLVDATDNDEGETYSVININFDAPILDLNVLVDLTHSWLEDLSLYLISPNGDRYLLSSAQGDQVMIIRKLF